MFHLHSKPTFIGDVAVVAAAPFGAPAKTVAASAVQTGLTYASGKVQEKVDAIKAEVDTGISGSAGSEAETNPTSPPSPAGATTDIMTTRSLELTLALPAGKKATAMLKAKYKKNLELAEGYDVKKMFSMTPFTPPTVKFSVERVWKAWNIDLSIPETDPTREDSLDSTPGVTESCKVCVQLVAGLRRKRDDEKCPQNGGGGLGCFTNKIGEKRTKRIIAAYKAEFSESAKQMSTICASSDGNDGADKALCKSVKMELKTFVGANADGLNEEDRFLALDDALCLTKDAEKKCEDKPGRFTWCEGVQICKMSGTACHNVFEPVSGTSETSSDTSPDQQVTRKYCPNGNECINNGPKTYCDPITAMCTSPVKVGEKCQKMFGETKLFGDDDDKSCITGKCIDGFCACTAKTDCDGTNGARSINKAPLCDVDNGRCVECYGAKGDEADKHCALNGMQNTFCDPSEGKCKRKI